MSAVLRNDRGMTLFELIAVMLIIGVLSTIAVPEFISYREKAFNSAAASDLKALRTSMESFALDNQEYPTDVLYR
jgi:prepilin-type N-terminal cleavage/methylation domain